MNEIITGFFDSLKSLSSGYASLDYEHNRWEESAIQKVIFYLNSEPVDALTFLVHSTRAVGFAKRYCLKLKELLPA